MTDGSVAARLRGMALAVWHFVSRAPLTYGWLVVLTITTIIQNQLPGRQLHSVLLHRSTNIHALGSDPLDVLFSSLLWIDGRNLEPYLLLFTLFLAPAEQIGPELPKRLDWPKLHELKRRWGLSLKALVMRSYKLDRFGETTYLRAMKQLSEWGVPEPGPLGPPERPVLLSRALELIEEPDVRTWLAEQSGLPVEIAARVIESAGGLDRRPAVNLEMPGSTQA